MVIKVNRIYLCIDLKTFFASVECVERGLDPFKTDLIVAAPAKGNGAICLAISPKMKNRGIKNRCRVWEIPKYIKPIVAKPRMKKYIEYSAKTYGIYLKYVSKEDIHVYSIDECFLDITTYLKMYKKSPIELAKIIITDVYQTTGITATVGIGTNLYLAKIALDITAKHVKSNIGCLTEEKYKQELWHHVPLTDFWQVGKGIEKRLNKLGLYNMYDIAHCNETIIFKEFGVNARYLIDHSKGIEPCTIKDIKIYKPKSHSLSNSQILHEEYDYQKARIVLTEMIDYMTLRIVNEKKVANIIGFHIGYSKDNKPSLIVNKKLENATNSFTKINKILLEEYDNKIDKYTKIKRIGITFSDICERKYEQYDLFSNIEEEQKDEKLEETINLIKSKYGKDSILRGISYTKYAKQRERNKLIGGHNAE